MKPILILMAGSLAIASCKSNAPAAENTEVVNVAQQQATSPGNLKTISSTEAKTVLEKQPDIVVIDVRTPEEYAGGHLKNARLINKYDADFEAKIKALDRNQPYLIYCASGGRSGETLKLMKQLDFKQVYDAKGYEDLKNAGVPVEK